MMLLTNKVTIDLLKNLLHQISLIIMHTDVIIIIMNIIKV
jgi:hypothetical protein